MEKEMVLVKEENLTKRKIREKIEIEMNEYCLNRKKGNRLSDIQTLLLHSLGNSRMAERT